MKALLVSTYGQASLAQHLLTGLRQRIGTCEFFAMDEEQQANPERFFSRFIRLAQFDRIIFEAPQEWIYKQSQFLRRLPHLAILSLHAPYTARQKRLLKRNLHVMPWLRMISSDHELVHELIGKGFDAYWIRPTFDESIYRVRRAPRQARKCLVFTRKIAQREAASAALTQLPLAFAGDAAALHSQLHEKDFFLYLPEAAMDCSDFRFLVKALACGAIVLMPDPGAEAALRYHWRDGKNCVFYQDIDHAAAKIAAVLGDEEQDQLLSCHGLMLAQHFTPGKVGEMLGGALEPAVRNAAEYPHKIRIFGFEF